MNEVCDTVYDEILIALNELILNSGFYTGFRFFLNNQTLQLKEYKTRSVSTKGYIRILGALTTARLI
jgi:hypothetical protein